MASSKTLHQAPSAAALPAVSVPVALAAALIVAYVAAILFGPVVNGHDTWLSILRVDTWRHALAAGDPFFVWTPADANGFGSPVPFFYHKLFNLTAASVALATGDAVLSARVALLLFSALMFAGFCLCAARCGTGRGTRIVVAVAGVLSPYAVVCIVQRGAFAEYAAMTLMPLCLALTLDFFQRRANGWHALRLFVLLMLVALAHLVTFAAADALLLACAIALLLQQRTRNGMLLLAASGTAALAFAVFIYVPFTVWGAGFCPGQARLHGLPADNAVAPYRLLSPNPGSWFGWPVLALLGGLALQFRARARPPARVALATGGVAVALLLMMSTLSAPLWRLSSVFDFVQFPWRLLSIATPLVFVAFAALLEQYTARTRRRLQIALLVVTALNTAGLLHATARVFSTIAPAALAHPATAGPGPDAGGEYFPARYQASLAALPDLFKVGANAVLPARRPLIDSAGGCTAEPVAPLAYFRQLRTGARCTSAGQVRVNQFDTPFLDVTATGGDGRIVHPDRGDTPFFTLTLARGDWVVRVTQKTYFELVGEAWGQKFRQWRGTGVRPEQPVQ